MSGIQQIGQYRIEAQISEDVYRAVDMVRRRPVTLRIIDPARFDDTQALQRFLQYAQAAADLVHPHLAWVWETGEDGGYIYVAERHIPAPTLRQRLDEAGLLSWAEASQAVEQLASGLDFLHGRSRVHGRVRPDTIYLSPELGAVLGGFGAPPPAVHNDVEVVEAGRYAAPEAASSAAADRYALACVLAEMLAGRPIFDAATIEQIAAQQQAELNFPAAWPSGTPWQIEPVLERALAARPEKRFDSAAGFAAAPALWAAHASADDEAERLRREGLRQQRRAADDAARRQAEEASRLDALEQARREVEVQAQVEPASAEVDADLTADGVTNVEQPAPSVDAAASQPGAVAPRRRNRAQPRPGRRLWTAGLLSAALAIAFFLAWNNGMLGALSPTQTPTASFTATTAPTHRPVLATMRPSPTSPPTAEPTFTATATRRPTATRPPTRTSTASPSATATQRPATATPQRQEPPEENSSLLD